MVNWSVKGICLQRKQIITPAFSYKRADPYHTYASCFVPPSNKNSMLQAKPPCCIKKSGFQGAPPHVRNVFWLTMYNKRTMIDAIFLKIAAMLIFMNSLTERGLTTRKVGMVQISGKDGFPSGYPANLISGPCQEKTVTLSTVGCALNGGPGPRFQR